MGNFRWKRDGALDVWDLENGREHATLVGHAGWAKPGQVSLSSQNVFTNSQDKTVKLWNLESGTCIGTFEGHAGVVDCVAVTEELLASSSWQEGIWIWNWRSAECLQVIRGVREAIYCSLAFSPNGQRLFIGTIGCLYVYRITINSSQLPQTTRRYVNAKVVLVGESGVGKSGLAHRLIEDQFVHTHSTHGMQVWRLDLPIEPEEDFEREALLWDLAGQEDYRLIHQLFLDETALALLLFNPQEDDPFSEISAWLKVLSAAGPKTNLVRWHGSSSLHAWM